jgi:hypothetical protein
MNPLRDACVQLMMTLLEQDGVSELELELAFSIGSPLRGTIEQLRDYAPNMRTRLAAAELLAIFDAKTNETQEFIQQELDGMVPPSPAQSQRPRKN